MSGGERLSLYGLAAHRAEEDAIEWVRAALPNLAPYTAWGLFSFETDDHRRYEIDALVLTTHALFVVELKSWRGKVVEGDVGELVTLSAARGREVVDHPLPLLTKKMWALKNRIQRVSRKLGTERYLDKLRYEELVWLSHSDGFDDKKLPEGAAARSHVIVGREALNAALRQAAFPGARPDLRDRTFGLAEQKALRDTLAHADFGLKQRAKELSIFSGRTKLGALVEEGRDFQDRWTVEPNETVPPRRVRSYLVSKADAATEKQVERRAGREAEVLRKLGEHPDILALDGFDPAGPLGPALVFRGFEGVALDRFVRQTLDQSGRSSLSIQDKLTILQRIAHALDFCHRNEVIHGALSPEAVLVRQLNRKAASRDGWSKVEIKVTRFALATEEGGVSSGNVRLLSRLGGTSASVYEATEVLRGAKPDVASDIFSLGAIAYFLFAEQAPAKSSAELQQRLTRDNGLLLSAVRSDVEKSVEDVVFNATHLDPALRLEAIPSPIAFVTQLEDALTVPEETTEASASAKDPLEASKGDRLGDLIVLGELGTGASAKALKVVRQDREDIFFALKVPLSDEHNERLAREGEVLTRLGENPGLSNITRLVEAPRTIAGRTCLLVEFAGDRTLAEELRDQGTISLEFIRRWGEELLLALRALEEAGVHHRDIKPSNIGLTVGLQKQKKRLLLFDFSLASAADTDTGVGTPAYRDPALPLRSRWDDAADRWSAAVTLYEMFTGTRPAPDPARTDPGELAVKLEGDRIDAAVRDRVVEFFKKCFRFGAERRFTTADDMREGFLRALQRVSEETAGLEEELLVGNVSLTALGPADGIQKLGLPTRASNALDRMGIYTLHDLAVLKPNWLNGVRGVGQKTARFIIELSRRIQQHLEISETPIDSFYPEWSGENVPLERARVKKLPAKLVDTLEEAGIRDARQLATSSRSLVKNLISKARTSGAAVTGKEVKDWLEGLVDTKAVPSTLRAGVNVFTTGKERPALERLRIYLGLKSVDGYAPGNANELAERSGVTRQLISLELQKFRNDWKRHGAASQVLIQLYEPLFVRLKASGGVIPLQAAADLVLTLLPPEEDVPGADIRRFAEAMVRIVGIVNVADLDVADGVRLVVKNRPAGTLVAVDRTALELADLLGEIADAAVRNNQVLSESAAAQRIRTALGEASESIREADRENALALADRALVELAVAAATDARLSVRGELYPKGLDPLRAVMLSGPALQASLTVDEVKRRIRARYPDGKELPDRTELDELLKPLRLKFNETLKQFVPTDPTSTPLATEVVRPRTTTTAGQAQPLAKRERSKEDEPGRNAARIFNEQLDHAMRDGAFRVLLWRGLAHAFGRHTSDRAPDAVQIAKAVAIAVKARHVSVDGLLLKAAREVAEEKKLKGGLAPALKADASGPASPQWQRLIDLMGLAVDRMREQVQASDAPLVLTDLGLCARYNLLDIVEKLAKAHRSAKAKQPTLVVLPVYAGEGAVVQVGADVAEWLNADPGTGLVPIKGLLRHEVLEVPSPWVVRHAPPAPRRLLQAV